MRNKRRSNLTIYSCNNYSLNTIYSVKRKTNDFVWKRILLPRSTIPESFSRVKKSPKPEGEGVWKIFKSAYSTIVLFLRKSKIIPNFCLRTFHKSPAMLDLQIIFRTGSSLSCKLHHVNMRLQFNQCLSWPSCYGIPIDVLQHIFHSTTEQNRSSCGRKRKFLPKIRCNR